MNESEIHEVLRYFILYEYGGVYIENDVELLKPLDEKVFNQPCTIAQEPEANAYLM